MKCYCSKLVVVFILIFALVFSMFFFQTCVGSLQESITKHFRIETYQFALLLSMGSWAAVFDVVHGYLLDRYLEIVQATTLYSSALLVGAVLFAVAGFTRLYWLLIIATLTVSIGMGPLTLCQNKHMINWFGLTPYVSMVFSVMESTIWLGSSAAFFLSVNLQDKLSETYKEEDSLGITMAVESLTATAVTISSAFTLAFLYKNKNVTPTNQSTPLRRTLVFKDYINFPIIFWALVLATFLYYASLQTFIGMSQVYFMQKFDVSVDYASNLSGTITLIGALLGPPVGVILDRIGHNLTSLSLSIIFLSMSQGLLAFTNVGATVPVVLMGASIVLSASLWSMFQYLAEEHQVMVGYGIAQTALSLSVTLGSLTAGFITNKYGYENFIKYLFYIVLCTIPCLVLIWVQNYKRGNILNLKPNQKQIYLDNLRKSRLVALESRL